MSTAAILEWAHGRGINSLKQVIAVLHLHEAWHSNLTSLAELTGVSCAGVTGLVDRLEKLGIAERRAVPNDRRAWNIHLADDVRAELDAILNPPSTHETTPAHPSTTAAA